MNASDYTQAVYERVSNSRIEFITEKFSEEEISCLGFRFKVKRVHPSLKSDLVERILPAYYLLDESMLPANLRNDSSRPEFFARKPGKVIKLIDRYLFLKGAGGMFNGYTKTISFPLFILDFPFSSWPISLEEYLGKDNKIFFAANGWRNWTCGTSQAEGTFGIVLHEYGHNLDFSLQHLFFDSGKFSSKTNEWKKLHKKEYISPYATVNRAEDFAESFAVYVLDPLMKCYAPEKFAYLSQFVKVNADVYGSPVPYESLNCQDERVQILLEDRAARVEQMKREC